ncbi:UNVERIFIED_CONTAM: protein MAINTENANCE OF MERISTEMS [Sesamum radiatum]|uniref:Protein MAINTENANCE OF MERISTEMS n=1 Tax=Sesamum radiatum TaxID=300843 RepID=A0AAW2LB18_SESRA
MTRYVVVPFPISSICISSVGNGLSLYDRVISSLPSSDVEYVLQNPICARTIGTGDLMQAHVPSIWLIWNILHHPKLAKDPFGMMHLHYCINIKRHIDLHSWGLKSPANLVSLLYLAKLEDIVAARNYSWGSAVLAFLYRELCNASEKGKAAIGGALQLVQIWAWSRIIPICPGLGAPRVHMGPHQIDNNRVLQEHHMVQCGTFIWQPYDMESNVIMAYAGDFNPQLWRSICPLIFYAIVEMHHPERVLRQFGMMQNIPDQPDTRDMSLHKITRSNRTGTDWVLQHILYITRWQRRLTRSYKDNPFPTEEIQIEDIGNVERGDIGVDIAGPSTAYTPQDYYVPQPPQDYYVPQPSQDDWFQSTSYMPSHAEAYSSHVDLDLGLGFNQPYAPEYNISPVPFPSFSAYRDNVESSSAASSSGLHINSGGDDNDRQNEPIQNMGEEIRRPRRQRHRRVDTTNS